MRYKQPNAETDLPGSHLKSTIYIFRVAIESYAINRLSNSPCIVYRSYDQSTFYNNLLGPAVLKTAAKAMLSLVITRFKISSSPPEFLIAN